MGKTIEKQSLKKTKQQQISAFLLINPVTVWISMKLVNLVEDLASLYRSPSALSSCPARPAMAASRVSGGMQGSSR
ncbi:hypothetical protein LINGRAHAP2_LOCUS15127 [Linum grandiflorum]